MNSSYAPVASTLFDVDGERGIAFTHYGFPDGGPPGPAGIATYTAGTDGGLQLTFNLTTASATQGPETGTFMGAPDLGEDRIHFYRVQNSPAISALTEIALPPGSGPRHGVFQTAGNSTFSHLVSELANNVTSFKVSYDGNNSISMTQIGQVSTFGDKPVPAGALAGEIIISPDGFVANSNRLDNSFTVPSLDPSNPAQEQSDSLAIVKADKQGKPSFANFYLVGCQSPRQIQANNDGSLLAAACMANDRVVIIERNNATGEIGKVVANYGITVATFVGWDE